MIKKITPILFLLSATCAWAVNSPINGLVQANCSIYTTTPGEYGNPSPWKLSTTAADGGVFAFGKAQFFGGLAERSLYRPVIDLLSTPDGAGYLLVAADGAVYAKGAANFRGSLANNGVSSSLIVAAEQTVDGKGYWLVSQRGKIFTFGTCLLYTSPSPRDRG